MYTEILFVQILKKIKQYVQYTCRLYQYEFYYLSLYALGIKDFKLFSLR